jgi:DNA-binding IclR family transcriptional regulator
MAWADDAAVRDWLDRAMATGPAVDQYQRVLAEIRAYGFSVPLRCITSPAVRKAIARVRDEPTDEDAEHQLADAVQHGDEMLLLSEGLSVTDEVTFTTVVAPIFDPIGRPLLSISITGPEHPVPVEEILRLGHRLLQSAAIATADGRGRIPDEDQATRATTR